MLNWIHFFLYFSFYHCLFSLLHCFLFFTHFARAFLSTSKPHLLIDFSFLVFNFFSFFHRKCSCHFPFFFFPTGTVVLAPNVKQLLHAARATVVLPLSSGLYLLFFFVFPSRVLIFKVDFLFLSLPLPVTSSFSYNYCRQPHDDNTYTPLFFFFFIFNCQS